METGQPRRSIQSREPAGWSENTKQEASPLSFCLFLSLLSLFSHQSIASCLFLELLDLSRC